MTAYHTFDYKSKNSSYYRNQQENGPIENQMENK
jgi:hypothetical protein